MKSQNRDQFVGLLGSALITPFEKDGRISWTALSILVEQQISGGASFLVPGSITGEASTLTHDEHNELIRFAVEKAAGRIPVLAGTGSNSTAEAAALTASAKQAGAIGALVVSPYFNQPTEAGIKDYYGQVAKVGLPVILYDIPARCGGTGILPKTILELACEDTIQGFKWASGDLKQLQEVLMNRPEGFVVLAGDFNLFLAMCLGADGGISVLANLLPGPMAEFITQLKLGRMLAGREAHFKLWPLMAAMFIETNPIPIKTAMAMVQEDVFQENFRSPMVPMGKANKEKLAAALRKYGLLDSEPAALAKQGDNWRDELAKF